MADPVAATAVLIIDGWSSSCSACRKTARWDEEGHLMVLGYGDDNGTPGCGAKWSGVSFVYGWPDPWPDHIPSWIAELGSLSAGSGDS